MSIFSTSGRSASARRFSQAPHYINPHMQWPSPATLRQANISLQVRRRALDLYDTKDILLSHEQIKKASKTNDNFKGVGKLK
jgi:hypothetical protein